MLVVSDFQDIAPLTDSTGDPPRTPLGFGRSHLDRRIIMAL